MDTGIGKRTMDEIRAAIDEMTAAHRHQLDLATNRWAADIDFARIGMQIMTGFTVMLLLVVWLLAGRDTRQREHRRRSAQEEKQRLEAIVEERTDALSELSNHLQVVREEEKSKLARDIHDDWAASWSARRWISHGWRRVWRHDRSHSEPRIGALGMLDDGHPRRSYRSSRLRPTARQSRLVRQLWIGRFADLRPRRIQCGIVVPANNSVDRTSGWAFRFWSRAEERSPTSSSARAHDRSRSISNGPG